MATSARAGCTGCTELVELGNDLIGAMDETTTLTHAGQVDLAATLAR